MIYQVHTGRWSQASLLKHPGQVFTQLEQQPWENLTKLGIDKVYLLGVFDNRGPVIVTEEAGQDLDQKSQRLPSPFALSDHRQTHPDLGTISQLKHLIDQLHSQHLKVYLDFVPNHRGLSHAWLMTQPGYAARYLDGSLIKEFSGDVFKLNYHNPQLCQQMIQTIKTIASWGSDGVRVDMAHLIPLEFWYQAVEQVKSEFTQFNFIAEAYPDTPFDLSIYHQLTEAGFDQIYHGVLFNNLEQVCQNHQPVQVLADHLNYILSQTYAGCLVHYGANHDDFLDQLPHYNEAILGLIMSLPGEGLIYNGSLTGLAQRLAHHYYQELADTKTELKKLPANLKTIIKFFKDKSDHVHTVEVTAEGLLRAYATTYQLLVNLTDNTAKLPPDISLTGLIHQLSANGILKSGHAEIFAD